MVAAGVVDAALVVDPTQQMLLTALHEQERGLVSVAGRVSAELAMIPRVVDDGWEGPARAAYDVGLHRLRAMVEDASGSVDRALRETRAAIAVLDRRIG